ncbi:MAG: hypothetical protein R3A10_13635 [Caldilineaceae bacterium]
MVAPRLIVLEECHCSDALPTTWSTCWRAIADSPVLMVLAYRLFDLSGWVRPTGSTRCLITPRSNSTNCSLTNWWSWRARLRQLPAAGTPRSRTACWYLVTAHGAPGRGESILSEEFDQLHPLPRHHHLYDVACLDATATAVQHPGPGAQPLGPVDRNQKTMLKVASVIGRTFLRTGWRVSIPNWAKRTLSGTNWCTSPTADSPCPIRAEPGPVYFFKHVIANNVIYDSLLFMLRTALHESIAAFIEQTYPTRINQFLDILAYHYSSSDNEAKQREYLRTPVKPPSA